MGLGKQAKTLSKGQIDAMLAYLSTTRYQLEQLPAPRRASTKIATWL
jgi:hypothetical protein